MAEYAPSLPAAAGAAADTSAWLPFEELVHAHCAWQNGVPGAEAEYRAKLRAFQDKYGEIVESYWCSSIPSAVALTSNPTATRRLSARSPRYEFHRLSDWATKNQPDVAALLHKCDELAIKVDKVLRGPARRILMRLVTSSAGHILSLVADAGAPRKSADRAEALAFERQALDDTQRYYEEVGLRQSQMVYFLGMVVGALAIGGAAFAVWAVQGFDRDRALLACVLGAAGALVSVMERMGNRKERFQVDYELGPTPVAVLGSFRPLIGAAFGLVVYAALASGIVNIKLESHTQETYLYALLSFVGGFSERLAKDVLDAAEKTVGAAIRAKPREPRATPNPPTPAPPA